MPQPIKEEDLQHITKMVYALYARYGFDGISMDEVSRQTNISKATLYRYFTSKEDIVRGMVDYMIFHLNSVRFDAADEIHDVMKGVSEYYTKSILITSLSGSEFLKDLKNKFPDCYGKHMAAMDTMQERFSGFYKKSVELGYFRDLSFILVNRQFMNMLPVIVDMDYLEENGLLLADALKEYYRIFCCQILSGKYLCITDEPETYDFVDDLAAVLLNDFFIDTIRR